MVLLLENILLKHIQHVVTALSTRDHVKLALKQLYCRTANLVQVMSSDGLHSYRSGSSRSTISE